MIQRFEAAHLHLWTEIFLRLEYIQQFQGDIILREINRMSHQLGQILLSIKHQAHLDQETWHLCLKLHEDLQSLFHDSRQLRVFIVADNNSQKNLLALLFDNCLLIS